MKTLSHLLWLAFAFLALHASAANIAYKCTNSTGEISFLDKRPSEGCVTIEEVNIGSDAAGDVGENEENSTDALAELDKKEIAEREQKAKEDCAKRKTELETLRSRTQIVISDPITKEKKVLSPEEHQTKIRQYEEYIKTFCSGVPSSTTGAKP